MMVSLKMLNWMPTPSKLPFSGSSAAFKSSAAMYMECGSISSNMLMMATSTRSSRSTVST